LRGVPLVDESCGDVPYACVKYGMPVSLHEAKMQHFVAQAVNDQADAPVRVPLVYLFFQCGRRGYIVMEFIDGLGCTDFDALLVADAVRSLIDIKSPTTAPGPLDEGPIVHHFFYDWRSPIAYDSVRALKKHVNAIQACEGRSERVDFQSEFETHGLPLCPCNLDPTNFMTDCEGRIVAIDFGATCFLPRSFFDLALFLCHRPPALVRLLDRPRPEHLNVMLEAHVTLLLHGTNKIGVYLSLHSVHLVSFIISYKSVIDPKLR
ncbi:hypothetical protein K523DRAFT_247630, partial [Schizophyllum commune Tattone D]